MGLMKTLGLGLLGAATIAMAVFDHTATAAERSASRIVAIGGSVTEIVYALGAEDRLVGRDSTSTYPEAARKLPDAGYIRALSPEGVLSLNPDLILMLDGAGPPPALDAIKAAGVPTAVIPDGYDRNAVVNKIEAVGKAIGEETKAHDLAARVEASLNAAVAASDAGERKARVLFILSMQGGKIMAAGSDNHADGIIRLAGGENVLSGIKGYKPVSDEAVIKAAPDVVLTMSGGGDHTVQDKAVLANAAIASTPAGKAGKIIRLDGAYLLGFGPRTADAIATLHKALYPASEAKPGTGE